jgi:hypothetical protein
MDQFTDAGRVEIGDARQIKHNPRIASIDRLADSPPKVAGHRCAEGAFDVNHENAPPGYFTKSEHGLPFALTQSNGCAIRMSMQMRWPACFAPTHRRSCRYLGARRCDD